MLITTQTKIAGVIGHPIGHSLSPKLHNYFLEKNKINGIYMPFHVKHADNLGGIVKSFVDLGYAGFNVTLPYKTKIIEHCHHLDPIARSTKAVNTVTIKDGELFGENSDGFGYVQNIKQQFPKFDFSNKNIVILGAGGASRAIIESLLFQRIKKLTIVNRDLKKAEKIINDLNYINSKINIDAQDWQINKEILQDCDLLINATSIGLSGVGEININFANLNPKAIVSDIVYKPLITDFLKRAIKNGNLISTGIGMLIFQALVGFASWFGIWPEVNQEEILKILNQS